MKKCRRLNGFTLIEITISLAILAVGLLALLALFPVGFDAAKRAANITQATIFAQQKMEETKKAGYPVTAANGDFSDSNYKWKIEVSDESPQDYLQKVTLTVSWKYRNKDYQEKFITYVAKLTP